MKLCRCNRACSLEKKNNEKFLLTCTFIRDFRVLTYVPQDVAKRKYIRQCQKAKEAINLINGLFEAKD